MRVLLAGASHEALALAKDLGHDVVACVDPDQDSGWHGLPVFDSDRQAIEDGGFEGVVVAIDNPKVRQSVHAIYRQAGVELINLVAGASPQKLRPGAGIFAQDETMIGVNAHLGDGVRLNVGACLMAGTVAGDFVTFAPRATAMENAQIGARSYIGANAVILSGATIGCDCVIGAGAVVREHVADGEVRKGGSAS